MSKNNKIYAFFMVMLFIAPDVFSANTITSNHNKVAFSQGVEVRKHQPSNPNSEFVSSSSFSSSGEFSGASSFSSKDKKIFSRKSFSINKEATFSGRPALQPKADRNIFSKSLFSIRDDAEFSSESHSAPKSNNGKFSTASSMFSGSAFGTP